MKNIIDNLGKNAGVIWHHLNNRGIVKQTLLMKITNMRENDFFCAIGWLAKENKIEKNGIEYRLGESDNNYKIGINAGKIWETLHVYGDIDAYYIPKLSGLTERDTYTALGWLAREGKLDILQKKFEKPHVIYKLK